VPEEIDIDTDRLRDGITGAPSGSLLRYIALTTALLAAWAAVAALQAGDTVNALGAVGALTRSRAIWVGSMALGTVGAVLFSVTLVS
jgi:hypothetical protein